MKEQEMSGLVCRKCGCAHMPVLYTRRRDDKVMRVRECRNCKQRRTTYES